MPRKLASKSFPVHVSSRFIQFYLLAAGGVKYSLCGIVVGAPSCLGRSGYKSWPGDQTFRQKFSAVFLSPSA